MFILSIEQIRQISIDFILEAFKYEVALRILEFSDLLFLLEFVILHSRRYVICVCGVLRVEHVSTQVQYGLLVLAFLVIFADLPLAECVDELADTVHKVGGVE